MSSEGICLSMASVCLMWRITAPGRTVPCHKVLEAARSHPRLLEHLIQNRKLPVAELAELSGVSRKTMERHRTYLVAILLAYTNGYEIIRGHLCQISPGKEGTV